MPFKPSNELTGSLLTEYNDIVNQIDTAASSSYGGGWIFEVNLSGTFTNTAVIGKVRDAYMMKMPGSNQRWTSVDFSNPTSGSTIVILRTSRNNFNI
jgi:hypothetical protein